MMAWEAKEKGYTCNDCYLSMQNCHDKSICCEDETGLCDWFKEMRGEEDNIHMNNYRRTKTTMTLINYHFVFCPRYRRKIFDIPGVEMRFKELTQSECKNLDIEILAMECHHDHVHLFLNCLPQMSPSEIMCQIKGVTSYILREEFKELSQMQSLWTRSYFVSTASNVSSATIKQYVDTQKTRY